MSKSTRRPAALVVALASLSFVVAACGGGPARNSVASLGHAKTTTTTALSSAPAAEEQGGGPQSGPTGGNGAGSARRSVSATLSIGGSYSQDLKFAQCLRAHGLPDFPDPSANGTFHISSSDGIVPTGPQLRTAEKACRKFMPNGGAPPSPAERAKMLAGLLKYSECMRSHGIADFPDPQSSNGRVGISVQASPGSDLDPNNPAFAAAQKVCQKFVPPPPD